MDSPEDDSALQLQLELEALNMTYDGTGLHVQESQGCTSISFHLHPRGVDDINEIYVAATLKLTVGSGYPEQAPPEAELTNVKGKSCSTLPPHRFLQKTAPKSFEFLFLRQFGVGW